MFAMRGYPQNLEGERFGLLVVVRQAASMRAGINSTQRRWVCKCDCGKEIVVFATNLRSGSSTSCGCRFGTVGDRTRTHGKKQTKTYKIWSEMKRRCSNPSAEKYEIYGGRGIKVCERWQRFENFLADMGEKPRDMTLDRINVDGPYSPENCRWATYITQANNKRNNRRLTARGVTLTFAQWSRVTGIPRDILRDRIDGRGWSIERALFTAEV